MLQESSIINEEFHQYFFDEGGVGGGQRIIFFTICYFLINKQQQQQATTKKGSVRLMHLAPGIVMTACVMFEVGRREIVPSIPGRQLQAELVLHPLSCTRHGVAFLCGDGPVLTSGVLGVVVLSVTAGGLGGVFVVVSVGGLAELDQQQDDVVQGKGCRESQTPVVQVGVRLEVGDAGEGLC